MKKKPKQIAAIIGIVLLVSLYVATLIVAILDFPGKSHLFAACLYATIGLPIILWLTIWSLDKLKRKEDNSENT